MGQPLTVVDAFTARAFSGNPAAVCILPAATDEAWMRAIAAELNLAATAFLHPEADGYRLRWLTPGAELKLCGHATLASAHVLWEAGLLAPTAEARFHTQSGLLVARRDGDWICLDMPARTVTPCPPLPGLAAALGVTDLRWVGREDDDFLVELPTAATVRTLAPDPAALAALPLRAVIVTAAGDGAPYDIVSRFFSRAPGIKEDPVTGSAHCALAPFWAGRLGKTALLAHQASARGGTLRLTLRGARVGVDGQAVTVSRGEIVVSPGGGGTHKPL